MRGVISGSLSVCEELGKKKSFILERYDFGDGDIEFISSSICAIQYLD